MIAQPDIHSNKDIARLGSPRLFWGITAGCVDSMVANHTAGGKPRRADDMTPGGRNTLRPDRAVIVYTNLIRRYFRSPAPIVLGGIEASLRRISHFDAWSGSIRRSILFDAKADFLLYGMAEKSIVALARGLEGDQAVQSIRGLCYIAKKVPLPSRHYPDAAIVLPDHQSVQRDRSKFTQMFRQFYANADPATAVRVCQKQDSRYLIQNPPQPDPTQAELDQIHALPFARAVHPYYARMGEVRALDTIRFALTTHRGCFGECRFCAIAVHQGRRVISRSADSMLKEAASLASHPDFKGIISDLGGPTANMYAMTCARKASPGACAKRSCLYPTACPHLQVNHQKQIRLLTALRRLPHIRKVFIGSGVRHDLILADKQHGMRYLELLLRHHISGQLKIAPEHSQPAVLKLMGKPGPKALQTFLNQFKALKRKTGCNCFLTFYLMAAHPGTTLADMRALRRFAKQQLHHLPEQVQIFTPTPATWSTLMYHTGRDPFRDGPIFVEKAHREKYRQKKTLQSKQRRRPLAYGKQRESR